VAEAVAVVAADQDDLRLDRLAQPRRQLRFVQLADGDEVVVFEAPGDGEQAQQPAGDVRQAFDPQEQRVAQGRGGEGRAERSA